LFYSEKSYCTIQWIDTKELDIISKENISLANSQAIQINVPYTISIDGKKRQGIIITTG